MDFWELLRLIGERYPRIVPILALPGIFGVVADAVKDEWPLDRLRAGIEATPFFLQTTHPARQWHVLAAIDPATADQKVNDMWAMVRDLSATTGIAVEGQLGFDFVRNALEQGWDAQRVKYELLNSVNTTASGTGTVGKTASDVNSLAEAYGLPLGDQQALDYARDIESGSLTMEAIQGTFSDVAKNLYPALTPYLDRGGTIRDFANPYMQLAVKELGVASTEIDLQNPKWMDMFLTVDDSGEQRVRTLNETLRNLRTDESYGYDNSQSAVASATQLATQLQRAFGAAA